MRGFRVTCLGLGFRDSGLEFTVRFGMFRVRVRVRDSKGRKR